MNEFGGLLTIERATVILVKHIEDKLYTVVVVRFVTEEDQGYEDFMDIYVVDFTHKIV